MNVGNDQSVFRHERINVPSYVLRVVARPTIKKNKAVKENFRQQVKLVCTKYIEKVIATDDIEIEVIYATRREKGQRIDIDNVLKPTLDALKGVVYKDDSQVRSVTATLVDKSASQRFAGRVEVMMQILPLLDEHAIVILIYSDTRLKELGGSEAVMEKRWKTHQAFMESLLSEGQRKDPMAKEVIRRMYERGLVSSLTAPDNDS